MEVSHDLNLSNSNSNSKSKSKSKVSGPQIPIPTPLPTSTATREDGDLSSSSDAGENRVSLPTQLADSVNPTAPGFVLLPPSNKFTENFQARKAFSGLNPTTSVDIQSKASMKPNNERSLEKRQVPLKSAQSTWNVSSGTNCNLVISFSDDDTGSESEDHNSGKALEIKQNRVQVDGNQRVPSLVSAKSSKIQHPSRNVSKAVPKNLSMNHTFVLSTAKVNKGGVHSRVAASSAVDLGPKVRNFSTVKRNAENQENGGFEQGVVSKNSKLQDLRQQIALRERELKLKAAQLYKESASVVGREDIGMILGVNAATKSKAISKGGGSLEFNEPRKRIKVSGSCSAPLASEGLQEILAVKSSMPLKEQASECSSLQNKTMTNHSQKGSPTRTESNVSWKKKNDEGENVSPEDPPNRLRDGTNISNNLIQTDKRTLQHNVDSLHPAKINEHHQLVSLLKTSTNEKPLLDGCENPEGISKQRIAPEGISKQRIAEPPLDNVCQDHLNNFSLPNYFGSVHDSENSNMDMHSLVEMEESLDKELEEAQEHRRMCEIEERNALKAYRKAQRKLVEANAKCTELYHKRELYSTHLRSFILNDSSLFWSMRKHEYAGNRNHVDNGSKNLELIPSSTHPKSPDCNGRNELRYDLSNKRASSAPLARPYMHVDGQNLGSEPCSEPDASTSEPMHHSRKGAVNMLSSPSNDPEEDEETSPFDRTTVLPNYKTLQAEPNSVERQKDIQTDSNNKLSIDSSIDSMVLEASLRSELFARLGKRVLPKTSGSTNLDPACEHTPEIDNGSEKTQTSNGSVPLSEAEKSLEFDTGGNDQSEREISGDPVQMQSNNNQNSVCTAKDHQSAVGVSVSASVLRSAFGHVKAISLFPSIGFQSRTEGVDAFHDETRPVDSGKIQCGILTASTIGESANGVCSEEMGSFTCDLAVDPFWPLCMYELRGKCNNDQCPWQHVRDFSKNCVGQHALDNSDIADFQVELTEHQKNYKSSTKFHNCASVVTPPTYLVGVDILRADPHTCETLVTRKVGRCWQKFFSICLALSNLLQKDVPPNELLLHGNDGRIEVVGNWDKRLSYFQSRNSTANHLNQILPSDVQALEMAFFMLSQEVNKLDGVKKALSVLSRAIETDPKSEVMWMTYLLIYYGNVKSDAKDDMFSYAVKYNDGSYGLWLMYINSRLHLDGRLAAYEAALTVLCHHSSGDKMYDSACILDLFLQMMDCLCMSGNVAKAIQKINGLLPEATNSDQHHSLLVSDILACLTISDKCMFWVCCVYLVIYRKLPEAVVHKFECDKEFFPIDWPRTNISDQEKKRVVKLFEIAVDSINLSVDSVTLGCQTNQRSLQSFGLCHIGCMVALDGLEYSRSLFDEYMKLCPYCVEFAVISARFQMTRYNGLNPEGFEEVLRNWPKETPGIHCIWNQYIESAFQKGYPDFAKELTARWYDSFPEVRYTEKEKPDIALVSNPDSLEDKFDQMDKMFGYLNLSLAELLHGNQNEAHNAIDRAYKAASPPFFEHCLKEHAAFLLAYDSALNDSSFCEQLKVLRTYLEDAHKFLVPEPLPRQFIKAIEKPRVRQLVSNILSPVPTDFSVVNLVLDVWYGPTLVPPKFSQQPKELVDFIEAILEIVPSNYKLAISVCNLLIKGENIVDATSGSSMLYWASSTLVNALLDAVPVAPEYVWVDAANILNRMEGIESISDRFYRRAVTVYPFSVKLWNCCYSLSKRRGDAVSVVEAAREKGIGITV